MESQLKYVRSGPILFLFLGACWIAPPITLVTSAAPNGLDKIVVTLRPHGADGSLAIDLIRRGRNLTIYSDRGDRMPTVAEVVWLQESPLVGVLVCDPASADHFVVVGYNTTLERKEESARVMQPLRAQLVARYGLTQTIIAQYDDDPISWACSQFSGATDRFGIAIGQSRVLPRLPAEKRF